jgi:hypothetical protein
LGFPSLRTTWCSEALARGVPAADVAAIAGHSGTAMLQKHYDRRTSAVRAMALIGNGGLFATGDGNGKKSDSALPPSSTSEELAAILRAMTPETWEADRNRALELIGASR